MAHEAESEELVMIAEKARALLSLAERQALGGYCSSYLAGAMSVRRFVDALQRLLPTPDKATFLVELRELVRDEDASEYDNRVFALKRPFRPVRLQSDNGLRFESTPGDAVGLLQTAARSDRRPAAQLYFNPMAFSGSSSETQPTATATHQRRPRFRSALHETRVPMATPDMASAFPVAASTNSAFSRVSDAKVTTAAAAAHRSSADSRTLEAEKKPAVAHAKSRQSRPAASDDGLIEVLVPKTSNILGIAIEGGADTRHRLPRIIGIDGKGTAFESAGLRIGQTIIQVDGTTMEGLSHQEAAVLIASSYADRTAPQMEFILSASTFRPNANYQPEN